MTMPITKEQYIDLKEYWDYQRKVAYNKEMLDQIADQFKNRVHNEFGIMEHSEIKKILWDRVESEDYEDPPKHWVPQDATVRFDWEIDPNTPKQLAKPKGKPVILRAKDGWEKAFDDNNNL
jgi:hypothetical protein